MTRSILPSCARRRARKDKARAHRSERRSARDELENALDELDGDGAAIAGARRPPKDARAAIARVVNERRWADKLNPFIRWAHARTKHLSAERRLGAARAFLGRSTVVTDHALDHFEGALESELRRALWAGVRRERDGELRPWRSLGRLTTLLARAIRERHARLNEVLLETGFVRDCDAGDRCWTSEGHVPAWCRRCRLAGSPRDAARLAGELWRQPTPDVVRALDALFRSIPRARGAVGHL